MCHAGFNEILKGFNEDDDSFFALLFTVAFILKMLQGRIQCHQFLDFFSPIRNTIMNLDSNRCNKFLWSQKKPSRAKNTYNQNNGVNGIMNL